MVSKYDDIDEMINDPIIKGQNYNNPVQRIKVIGVGGGGNNAVIHMHKKGIKDVSFVLINTDRQVLDSSSVPTKVLIGPGLGAGGNPELARKYAEENAEEIARLFEDNTDMVFITAGMGGGTGTGAGPVVARIAKEKGILTVGIVTVPFLFEGELKVLKALEGADKMAKNVDSLLIINNERLYDIYLDMNIFNAFANADDTLLNAAQSITDIITNRGVINRDFNDVDTTLREGGSAIISSGYGEGPNRVTDAIKDALDSPLLKDTDIFNSKKLLLILYISDDEKNHPFNMGELKALNDFQRSLVNKVDVIWGLYPQSDLGDKVRITILASGFKRNADPGPNGEPEVKATYRKSDPEKLEKIEDTYGFGNTFEGKVLSPDSYDNPEDEELRALEDEPAISRSPYNKYMGDYKTDLGSAKQYESMSGNARKAADEEKERPTDNGGITLNFDDWN